MITPNRSVVILMADDDDDDRVLARDALAETGAHGDLHFVNDGVELLEYLRHEGQFADRANSPRPGLILLDLNMPRLDGRDVLRLVKADPEFQSIPVVVMTTSRAEEDVVRSYGLGASSFITKPVSFAGLVDVMRGLGKYWLEIVELPRGDGG